MTESWKSVSSQQIDFGITEQREKLEKRWKENSFLHKLKKGPLASTLYAMTLYPRVFFDRHISKKSQHPELTVYQETAIRTIRHSLNSSLSTIRNNSAFIESPLKASRCTEPIEPVNVTGMNGYWLGPKIWKGRQAQAILLHVHGIGYVSSSSGIQSLCYLLKTLRTKYDKHVRVFAVDHALAPENPYPNGLSSVERAYRWLTASGIPGSQNVFLCGTSTGGTLILALLQKLYTTSTLPRPLGAILISPWVEVSCDALSYFTNSKFDILTTYFCQFATRSYLFGEDDIPINGEPREDSKNFQKDQKEIVAWLEGIEGAFRSMDGKKSVENKETNVEWKHEVVDVKNHSGEGNTPKKKRRSSRASRSSRKFRNSGCSRRPSSSGAAEMKTGMASARSSLTSISTQSPDDVQNNKKLAKRSSTIRFSDSLEIHTQADLDDIANIKRGSWIRKSLEPCQAPDVSESPSDVKMITSPLSPIRSPQTEEKKLISDTSDINPFTNPLISPLHTSQDLLAKFPPLFISYGGREIFKDDIEMFCRRCVNSKNLEKSRTKDAENENNNEEGKEFSVDEAIRAMENDMNETHPDVVIECNKDMVHSYPMLLGVFGKRSKETLTNIAAFLNTRIPTSSLLPILKPASLSDNASTNKNLKHKKSFESVLQASINNFLRKKQSPSISKVGAMENLNLDVVEKKSKTNHNIPVTQPITKPMLTKNSTFPSSRWSDEIILPVISSSSIFIPYSYPEPGLLNNRPSQQGLNNNKRYVYKRSHSENEIVRRSINPAKSVQKQNNISLMDSTKINIWSHMNARGDRMPNSRISPAFRPISIIEE